MTVTGRIVLAGIGGGIVAGTLLAAGQRRAIRPEAGIAAGGLVLGGASLYAFGESRKLIRSDAAGALGMGLMVAGGAMLGAYLLGSNVFHKHG